MAVRLEVLGVHRRRGAAPPELEEFWSRLGFVVIQGYGLTETAPDRHAQSSVSHAQGQRRKPIAGVEVKISEDGEILVRGDNVTSGYINPGCRIGEGVRGRLVSNR